MKPSYIDRVALIDTKNKQILLALSQNKDAWFIPGGKRENGETDEQALIREIKEELSVDIIPNSISLFTTLEGEAYGKPQGTRVRINYYTAKYVGNMEPNSEIAEVRYFASNNVPKLAETGKVILKKLKDEGLID